MLRYMYLYVQNHVYTVVNYGILVVFYARESEATFARRTSTTEVLLFCVLCPAQIQARFLLPGTFGAVLDECYIVMFCTFPAPRKALL